MRANHMSYNPALEPYIGLVQYLGATLGAQYEILLQDMENHVLLGIANAYINVRIQGGSVTPLAIELEKNEIWKQTDYLTNLRCESPNGHNVLSSFYFIKQDNRLIGILSINLDATLFSQSNSPDLHLALNAPVLEDASASSGNMPKIVDAVVDEYLNQHGITAARLSHQERQMLISTLKARGVFSVRGGVRYAAEKLGCSGATVYRYLQNKV